MKSLASIARGDPHAPRSRYYVAGSRSIREFGLQRAAETAKPMRGAFCGVLFRLRRGTDEKDTGAMAVLCFSQCLSTMCVDPVLPRGLHHRREEPRNVGDGDAGSLCWSYGVV